MTAPRPGPTDPVAVRRGRSTPGAARRRIVVRRRSSCVAGLVAILAWGIGANPGDAAFALSSSSDTVHDPGDPPPRRHRRHRARRGHRRARASGSWCAASPGARCGGSWPSAILLFVARVPLLGGDRPARDADRPARRAAAVDLRRDAAGPRRAGRHRRRALRRHQRRDRGPAAGRGLRRRAVRLGGAQPRASASSPPRSPAR